MSEPAQVRGAGRWYAAAVRSVFERLFGGSGRRGPGLTCYLRENGPVAFELDLFATAPRERAEVLLASALDWAWKDRSRGWTRLTRVSLSAFLADVPGGLLLAGFEGDLPSDITDTLLADALRRFVRVHPTALAAVVTSAPDRDLLFVQQHATDAVNDLLAGLGIDKADAARRPYAHLKQRKLEEIQN